MKFDPIKIYLTTSVSDIPQEIGSIEVDATSNVISVQLKLAEALEEAAKNFREWAENAK